MRIVAIAVIVSSLGLIGCASTNITTPASLSDAVYYTADPVAKTVSFSYSTEKPDSALRPVFYKKNGEPRNSASGSWDVVHNESLEAMFREYVSGTFAGPGSEVNIELRLVDVDLRSESQDGGGEQFMVAMFGGELESVKKVRQHAVLTVVYNGETHTKTLVGSASSQDVDGVGTGTETSNVYRGSQSDQAIFGRLLNESSNKLILQAAQYIRSLDL